MFKKKDKVIDVMSLAEDHPAVKYLGRKIKNVINGYEGICTAITEQSNGNFMLSLHREGEEKNERYVDQQVIDIIDDGIKERVGNVEVNLPFVVGDRVQSIRSSFQGTVASISWFINGCAQFSVVSPDLGEDGKEVHDYFLTEGLKKIGENTEVKKQIKTRTGGPSQSVHRAM